MRVLAFAVWGWFEVLGVLGIGFLWGLAFWIDLGFGVLGWFVVLD